MEDCWHCALPMGLALILAVFRGVPAPQLSALEPELAAQLLDSIRGLPLLTALEVDSKPLGPSLIFDTAQLADSLLHGFTTCQTEHSVWPMHGISQNCYSDNLSLLIGQEMKEAYAAAKHFGCNSLAMVCCPAALQRQPRSEVDPNSSAGQGCPACPDENMLPDSVQDAACGRNFRATSKRGQAAVEPFGMRDNSAARKRASLAGPKAQPAWTQCSSDTNDFTF